MPLQRKSHTAEFKLEAIRLAQRPDSSVPETAKALGRQMLYAWIREHNEKETPFPGKGVVSRDEERDFLKKNGSVLCQGTQMKYTAIKNNEDLYDIRMICALLKVSSSSGYYDWKNRCPSLRLLRNDELLELPDIVERHNPHSLQTWNRRLKRNIVRSLLRCPCCLRLNKQEELKRRSTYQALVMCQ